MRKWLPQPTGTRRYAPVVSTAIGTRHWILLGVVTAVALLLVWGAASLPAVCAAGAGSCTQEARSLPATIGTIVIVGLAALTIVVARMGPQRRVEGVSRGEGVIAAGTLIIGIAGVVTVVAVLFSAGFVVG